MRWLLFVPLLVVLAIFALSNPQDVEIRLWPFDLAWVSPLGIAVLILCAIAFLLGAALAWAAGLAARRRAAKVEEAARLLERARSQGTTARSKRRPAVTASEG